ncbi:GAF domain-containing protein [Streptomyces sp. NPDC059740]|uniref:GAF domain-containing protein n=1 Tax=Streptomyces sp. NPDC059740 TaxID=3346926 RepID=UPI003657777D
MTPSTELRRRRAALEDAWARAVPGAKVPPPEPPRIVRTTVADSWRRSFGQVDPERASAPSHTGGPVDRRWCDSPLRRPVETIAAELHSVAEDAGFVAAVTDSTGTILWTCGGRVMRRAAEHVNFAPGGRWDESAMGTNALSLALRTGLPHTVFSAEHLVAALHGWVCYCAPLTAPDGQVLGVLDLSTTWDRSHPLAMSTVRGLARAVEVGLAGDLPPRPPRSSAPQGAVSLTCLGEPRVTREGVPLRIPPRQLEILTLLALRPRGYPPEELRDALYGERPVSTSTFKAEVSRLRQSLGGLLTTRSYRLSHPIACDATRLLDALRCGDVATAVRLGRGPLLPRSDAPGVREWRDHLAVALQEAVLQSGTADDAVAYGERFPDSCAVHRRALDLLGPRDPRRALVLARLAGCAS